MKTYIVTEGIEGHWHYHLSDADKYTRGLCGAPTMRTYLDLDRWGRIAHLKERWCKECEKKREEGTLDKQNNVG